MANLKDTTIRGDLSVDGAISGGFLKPGDTWSANYWGGGVVTGGGTQFYVDVPIPALSKDVSGATVTKYNAVFRQAGNYIYGSGTSQQDMTKLGSITPYLRGNSFVHIIFVANSAPAKVSNNDCFGAYVEITLTLN